MSNIERASETVTVKASPELLNEMLGHWSRPVQVIAARNPDGTWEMRFRTYDWKMEVSDVY